MSARISNRSLVKGSLRERSTITLVAGLSGFYAAALMMGGSILQTLSAGDGSSVGVYLSIVAGVFIGIALYVAAVVITGCVARSSPDGSGRSPPCACSAPTAAPFAAMSAARAASRA